MGFTEFIYRAKYRIILLRKAHNAVFVLFSRTFNYLTALMKIDGRQYIIAIDQPAYIYHRTRTYLLDYDSGKQVVLEENVQALNPQELDMIVGNKLIKELTAGVMENTKEKILYTVIGFIIGGLLGVAIMAFVMQSKIEELMAKFPLFPTV